ncbi:MAG TPA: G1 family glutamic endopeptidase [Thermoplasmata archaeon]|nr:G1 family glutamic endopeptidase [Thermoplasmata archaeon]
MSSSTLGLPRPITVPNWGGFVDCPSTNPPSCASNQSGGRIDGIEATIVVPGVTSTLDIPESVATWVGVGSFSPNGTNALPDLIQVGVDAIPAGASSPTSSIKAWWETLPLPGVYVNLTPNPLISTGDSIFLQLQYKGLDAQDAQLWSFLIQDNTTGSTWNATEPCAGACRASSFESADWIVESPLQGSGGTEVPLPPFSSVRFDGAMYLNETGSWSYLTGLESTVYSLSQSNPAYSHVVVAVPSSVYPRGTFWVQYLVDTVDNWFAGNWGNVFNGVTKPGRSIAGNLSISSPDAISEGLGTNLGLAVMLTGAWGQVCVISNESSYLLSVRQGTAIYTVQGPVCLGLPTGVYSASLSLWYLGGGAKPGSSGTLLLFATGANHAGTVVVGDLSSLVTTYVDSPIRIAFLLAGFGMVIAVATVVLLKDSHPSSTKP